MTIHGDLPALESVIASFQNFPGRPSARDGKPGGLVELPPDRAVLVVGDLHANLPHLKLILENDDNRRRIASGERTLVLVGDLVHDEQTGRMKNMDTSVEIFTYTIGLMAECPKNVVYLRGNHDSFDERLIKSGIFQGKEFKAAMKAHLGEAYVEAAERFFAALPLFVLGDGFVVAHAGPVRGGASREELIEVRHHPQIFHQLIWNRVNEFRGTPSSREYGAEDVAASLAVLGLNPDTFFLVGHNPMWSTGLKTGVWTDVMGIKNHHIIYSSYGSRAPYFLLDRGKLETRYTAAEPALEQYSWTR